MRKEIFRSKMKNAYETAKSSLTKKEIVVKAHEKSSYFMRVAKKQLDKGDSVSFIKSIDSAIKIINALRMGLNFKNASDDEIKISKELYAHYTFAIDVLRKCLDDRSIVGSDEYNASIITFDEFASAYSEV